MKNKADYSKYKCPFSHLEKEEGHELKGPEGYQDAYGVWCRCGFRGPVFYLEPEELGLKMKIFEALYNEMTEESGYNTLSIHETREGAEDALVKHKEEEFQKWRKRYPTEEDEPFEFGTFEDWVIRESELLP